MVQNYHNYYNNAFLLQIGVNCLHMGVNCLQIGVKKRYYVY